MSAIQENENPTSSVSRHGRTFALVLWLISLFIVLGWCGLSRRCCPGWFWESVTELLAEPWTTLMFYFWFTRLRESTRPACNDSQTWADLCDRHQDRILLSPDPESAKKCDCILSLCPDSWFSDKQQLCISSTKSHSSVFVSFQLVSLWLRICLCPRLFVFGV